MRLHRLTVTVRGDLRTIVYALDQTQLCSIKGGLDPPPRAVDLTDGSLTAVRWMRPNGRRMVVPEVPACAAMSMATQTPEVD